MLQWRCRVKTSSWPCSWCGSVIIVEFVVSGAKVFGHSGSAKPKGASKPSVKPMHLVYSLSMIDSLSVFFFFFAIEFRFQWVVLICEWAQQYLGLERMAFMHLSLPRMIACIRPLPAQCCALHSLSCWASSQFAFLSRLHTQFNIHMHDFDIFLYL